MARISVIGGTGYAGRAIVQEAAARGHSVTSLSRKEPAEPVAGVTYTTGSALDLADLAEATAGADAIIGALSPRGPMEGQVRGAVDKLIDLADTQNARLGVIVGAGSLLTAPLGPRVMDTPEFPAAVVPEAEEMTQVLEDLAASPASLRWFAVSPAGGFGAHAPGSRTGQYRVGGDVLLVDAAGQSYISAEDLAVAVVDEIERPAHERARFTVAY
ncbi:MAG: NAD(P)H-binding protein [Propionibacteriaceae bacterium]|jgi:putative NADH-flavin reductase|nr:NAD(P)H-binding protein [Propionibacteriaceae bacterium]